VASPTRTDPQRTRADRRPSQAFGVGPLTDHPVVVALLYVADGAALAALAAGTLALDRWLGPDRTPSWLQVDTSVAQALTTGFGTSLLFVISVGFMVGMYALPMSAEPLSARVRRRSLADPVQRHERRCKRRPALPDCRFRRSTRSRRHRRDTAASPGLHR
jgi:hypothetical protein